MPVAACGHVQKTIGSIPTTTTSSASVQVPLDSTVGQSVTTATGNVITVYSFQSPVAFADAGFVVAAADIGACAAASPPRPGATQAAVSPKLFRVELADGTLQPSAPAVKQPALPDQVLAPGACARGWVSFRLPEQIRASFVVLRSLSAVRWRIS